MRKFKIIPIMGFENIVAPWNIERRYNNLKKLGEKIKEILEEEINQKIDFRIDEWEKIKKSKTLRTYPYFYLRDEPLLYNHITVKIIPGLEIYLFFSLLYNNVSLIYNEEKNEGYFNLKEMWTWEKKNEIFLLLNPEIRKICEKVFEYLESIYRREIIDLEEFIRFIVPRNFRSKEITNELFNEIKERLNISNLSYAAWIWGDMYRYNLEPGYYLPINDRIRFITLEEKEQYKDRFLEKIKVPWFSFEEGKIIEIPLYVYEYEKDKIVAYQERREEEILKPEEIDFEEFKEKIKILSKIGISFSEEILKNFYSAVNSANKFVILAGVTGTGKTLLSLIYPATLYHKGNKSILEIALEEAIEESKEEKIIEDRLKEKIQKYLEDYLLLCRVKPNWTSPRDLLGYYNPLEQDIKRKFIKGILYDFLEKAENEKDKKFFLILDEMNLSHPEHYLSDILSAMETKGKIYLHKDKELEEQAMIKMELIYPENLHIIGTINLDETTKELSPRLKSRAFVLELRADFDKIEAKDEIEKEVKDILKIIDENLQEIELGFGYRDFKQISEYVKKGGNLDDALLTKIIPRIRTTDEKFEEVIDRLIKQIKNYPKFQRKLEELKDKFKKQGYV